MSAKSLAMSLALLVNSGSNGGCYGLHGFEGPK